MLAVVFLLASAGTEVVIEAPKGASKEPICGGGPVIEAPKGASKEPICGGGPVHEAPKGASKEPICGGRRRVFAASGTGGGGTAITGALSTLSRTPCARSQSERSASGLCVE